MTQQKTPPLDTKERIIAAAIGEFAQKGFGGARVDEIAKAADVNKATLYYQIGDKAALYGEVLNKVMTRLADDVQENLSRATEPAEKMENHIRTIAASIGRNIPFGQIMLREIAGGGATLPDEPLRQMGRLVEIVGQILKEGREKGVFREAHPFVVHLMIIGSVMLYACGTPIRARVAASTGHIDDMAFEDAVRHIATIVINGITRTA